MRRTIRGAIALALLSLITPRAKAQFGFPMGYGGMGWGGFSAAAGYGMEAMGLGMLASGMGEYNRLSAEANAINVNTAMHLNEYMYESIRLRNARIFAARAERKENFAEAVRETEGRLRNAPTQSDIHRGDALNAAVSELSDPRYALLINQYAAQHKITGNLIRNIPFSQASAGLTFGLSKLTDAQPGPVLGRPEFAQDLEEYRKLGAQLRDQAERDDTVDPATVRQFRDVLQRAVKKVKVLTDVDAAQRRTALVRIQALLGLSYMLDGPSLDIFTAELKGDQEVGLDRLLAFMRSFNLRFGIATNPNQRQAYDTLFPLLVQVRRDAFGEGTGTLASEPPRQDVSEKDLENFFAGMAIEDLEPETHPGPPKAPAPGGGR